MSGADLEDGTLVLPVADGGDLAVNPALQACTQCGVPQVWAADGVVEPVAVNGVL